MCAVSFRSRLVSAFSRRKRDHESPVPICEIRAKNGRLTVAAEAFVRTLEVAQVLGPKGISGDEKTLRGCWSNARLGGTEGKAWKP